MSKNIESGIVVRGKVNQHRNGRFSVRDITEETSVPAPMMAWLKRHGMIGDNTLAPYTLYIDTLGSVFVDAGGVAYRVEV